MFHFFAGPGIADVRAAARQVIGDVAPGETRETCHLRVWGKDRIIRAQITVTD